MSDTNGRLRFPADPETLKALTSLTVRVRRVVEGLQGGAHPSLHFGASVEFAEHKKYSPGDDIRHIDWRALARTDRFFVKQHQREVVLSCLIVLDCSASMGYQGTRARTDKLGYAVELMAALAYILVRQGDAAGLMTFASKPTLFIPPARRPDQLSTMMRHFATLEAVRSGSTAFADATIKFLEHRPKDRQFAVFLSFTAPHDPWVPPRPYDRMYDMWDMPVPVNFAQTPPFKTQDNFPSLRDQRQLPWPRCACSSGPNCGASACSTPSCRSFCCHATGRPSPRPTTRSNRSASRCSASPGSGGTSASTCSRCCVRCRLEAPGPR